MSTEQLIISENSAKTLIVGFLSNRNRPRAFVMTTEQRHEPTISNIKAFFKNYKAKIIGESVSKDGWSYIMASKDSTGILIDLKDHRLSILVKENNTSSTDVIICCRFTDMEKFDLFRAYPKHAAKLIRRIAQVIDHSASLIEVTMANIEKINPLMEVSEDEIMEEDRSNSA